MQFIHIRFHFYVSNYCYKFYIATDCDDGNRIACQTTAKLDSMRFFTCQKMKWGRFMFDTRCWLVSFVCFFFLLFSQRHKCPAEPTHLSFDGLAASPAASEDGPSAPHARSSAWRLCSAEPPWGSGHNWATFPGCHQCHYPESCIPAQRHENELVAFM